MGIYNYDRYCEPGGPHDTLPVLVCCLVKPHHPNLVACLSLCFVPRYCNDRTILSDLSVMVNRCKMNKKAKYICIRFCCLFESYSHLAIQHIWRDETLTNINYWNKQTPRMIFFKVHSYTFTNVYRIPSRWISGSCRCKKITQFSIWDNSIYLCNSKMTEKRKYEVLCPVWITLSFSIRYIRS